MGIRACLQRGLFALTLGAASLLPLGVSAQDMVSVRGEPVNMRAGPGTGSEVLWELGRGYPLQVLSRKGRWLQVRDYEGDRGWVARSLTQRVPHHVVKSRVANLRRGPGTGHRIIARLEYGEVLRTREKRADWVRVELVNGQTGWVTRRLLWGW